MPTTVIEFNAPNEADDLQLQAAEGIRLVETATPLTNEQQTKVDIESRKKSKKPKEHKAVGSVKRSVYQEYLKASGYPGFATYVRFREILCIVLREAESKLSVAKHASWRAAFFGVDQCVAQIVVAAQQASRTER